MMSPRLFHDVKKKEEEDECEENKFEKTSSEL